MGLTTASSLRCTLVALTRSATAFLRCGFLTRAGNIAASLDSFPHKLALMLKVFKRLVNQISSQGLVEILLIKCDDFVCKATAHKVVNGHLNVVVYIKRSLGPGLADEKCLFGLFEGKCSRVESVK